MSISNAFEAELYFHLWIDKQKNSKEEAEQRATYVVYQYDRNGWYVCVECLGCAYNFLCTWTTASFDRA